jgi:circadian clock protein KaiC
MNNPVPRLKTHVAGLDDKLSGGMPEGFNVVIWGPVGTLKSSIAFSIMYRNAMEGKKGIYFSLEQMSSTLFQQASTMNMDINNVKDNMTVLDIGTLRRTTETLPDIENSDIDWGVVILNQVKALSEMNKIDLIVVDSLNVLTLFTDRGEMRRAMFHLFRELKELGLTALLIVEGPEEHIITDNHVFKYLADGLIFLSIERKDRSTTRLLQVVKMRSTNHPTDFYPLLFDKEKFKILTK